MAAETCPHCKGKKTVGSLHGNCGVCGGSGTVSRTVAEAYTDTRRTGASIRTSMKAGKDAKRKRR